MNKSRLPNDTEPRPLAQSSVRPSRAYRLDSLRLVSRGILTSTTAGRFHREGLLHRCLGCQIWCGWQHASCSGSERVSNVHGLRMGRSMSEERPVRPQRTGRRHGTRPGNISEEAARSYPSSHSGQHLIAKGDAQGKSSYDPVGGAARQWAEVYPSSWRYGESCDHGPPLQIVVGYPSC